MALPATTAYTIITGAMQDIGALALGEVPTSEEATACLISLNDMLDMWNTERLAVYNIAPEIFPYVPGTGTYTIGPGGDFDTDRPVKIESAYSRDSHGNDYKIGEVTDNYEYYSDIITKYTQATLPSILYFDGNFPLQNLYFWCVPSDGSYSVVLWLWKQLPQFQELNEEIILPPGYNQALKKNLSIQISPAFGATPTQELKEQAANSKAQIKRSNYNIKELHFDSSIVRRGRVFNYLNGE